MTDTPTQRRLYIGLDLGTSSLKAVAVGAGGEIAARAHAGYPTARPKPAPPSSRRRLVAGGRGGRR